MLAELNISRTRENILKVRFDLVCSAMQNKTSVLHNWNIQRHVEDGINLLKMQIPFIASQHLSEKILCDCDFAKYLRWCFFKGFSQCPALFFAGGVYRHSFLRRFVVRCRWQQTSSYFVIRGGLKHRSTACLHKYLHVAGTTLKGDVVNLVTFQWFYSFMKIFVIFRVGSSFYL